MTLSLLVVATLANALLIGLIPTLMDGIQKPIEARLKLSPGRTQWHIRLFYLAWLPGMPAAGWMLDHGHSKEILFFGLVAIILGVASMALARDSLSLMLNALFLGLAYSFITTAGVGLMTRILFPEYVDEYKLNIASLNLGFVLVGLGAMIGPWVVSALDRWWGYRQGLLYLSAILIAPAALTALCDKALFPKPSVSAVSWHDLAVQPQMGLIAGAILLYFALENCLEYWPEAFLKEIEYQERGVQTNMLVFWFAFIATRGAAAWWFYWYPDHGFVLTVLLVVASGCVVGNLAGGFDVGSSTFGFWLAGACYGPLLPGFLGMAMDMHYPAPLPVSALGILLALSGLDTLLVRPLMNAFAQGRPARAVMRVPTFLAFVLVAPLLLLALWRSTP